MLEWLYGLILDIVDYLANGLLDVFSMDLDYFMKAVPVTNDIISIVISSAWALLLGNMVFQAAKSMMSGIGLEGEEPRELFTRTFLFAFLLLVSRQICEIGLSISGTVIDMLQIPDSVSVSLPGEDIFGISASWLLMIVVGVVLMWQIVKLFFTIGERYFLVCFLTITAPWAFAMGGSKSTADIFKGWVRMFASMCLMMVLNVVFLKIIISAMGNMPSDGTVIAWVIFVVAVCRVARKIDGVVLRIGLNPASTGDGLGRGFLGNMASVVVMRTVSSSVSKAIGGAAGNAHRTAGGTPPPSGGFASTSRNSSNSTSTSTSTGGGSQSASSNQSTATQNSSNTSQAASTQSGTAGTQSANTYQQQSSSNNGGRRTSVSSVYGTRGSAYNPGTAGITGGDSGVRRDPVAPIAPGSSGSMHKTPGMAGMPSASEDRASRPTRFSSIPGGARGPGQSVNGTAGSTQPSRIQHGGVNVSAPSQADISNINSTSIHSSSGARGSAPGQPPRTAFGGKSVVGQQSPVSSEASGSHGTRYSRNQSTPTASSKPNVQRDSRNGHSASLSTEAGTTRDGRNAAPTQQFTPVSPTNPRDGRNAAAPTATSFAASRREGTPARNEATRKTDKPVSGTAGTRPKAENRPAVTKAEDVAKRNSVTTGTRGMGAKPGQNPNSHENRKSGFTSEDDKGDKHESE